MSDAAILEAYLPRLMIYVVWHPKFERGQRVAEKIHAYFSRNPKHPNARGLDIPVLYASAPAGGGMMPADITMDNARHTAVVALVDAEMVVAPDWDKYLEKIWQRAGSAPERHRLYPVAFSDAAYALSPEIAQVNYIRLQNVGPGDSHQPFLNQLTNELARLITRRPALADVASGAAPPAGPARMRLFLSHTKLDGLETMTALRDHIHKTLPLDTFFDAVDIEAGFLFEKEIDTGIENGALVVIQSDAYSTRVWCQHEVIRAKRRGRPVVVIHAVNEEEARSFPYLGNVPAIRWRAGETARLDAVLGLVLREVLRAEYFERHFADLGKLFGVPANVRPLPHAPELLTCLALRAESAEVPYFVYPDPPLAKQELDLLTELDPNLRLTTPTLLLANPAAPVKFADRNLEKTAAGLRVGLSISDSPDLARNGFGKTHLDDAASEFARFLLAAGAILAYGGDLRVGGFTEILFDLLAAYRTMTGETVDVVQSYLAWPIHLDLTTEQEAKLRRTARFHKFPAPVPAGIDVAAVRSLKDLFPATARNRVAFARSLTRMRERMNGEIDARVLLGGQARGLGKYPGLAEEALLALRQSKPVFLLGAFGGCAQAVIQAVCGGQPEALTQAFQSVPVEAGEAIALYNAEAAGAGDKPIDYPAITAEFKRAGADGFKGLNNALTEEENRRLFVSVYLPEVIALVLRGLSRLKTQAA